MRVDVEPRAGAAHAPHELDCGERRAGRSRRGRPAGDDVARIDRMYVVPTSSQASSWTPYCAREEAEAVEVSAATAPRAATSTTIRDISSLSSAYLAHHLRAV